MQVGPLIACAINTDGQVLEACGVYVMNGVLNDGQGVFELDGRQAPHFIAAVIAAVAGLCDGLQEGVDGVSGVGGVFFVGIRQIGRTHQAIAANPGLAGEVMEHQNALAEAGRAYLEPRSIDREWVLPEGPWPDKRSAGIPVLVVFGFRGCLIVIAIVEHDLEHPVGCGNLRLAEEPRPMAAVVQQRSAVAVLNSFEVTIDRATPVIGRTAVALVGLAEVGSNPVFRLVLIENSVALIVTRLADQPSEDASCIRRVEDARIGVMAIEGEDVVL